MIRTRSIVATRYETNVAGENPATLFWDSTGFTQTRCPRHFTDYMNVSSRAGSLNFATNSNTSVHQTPNPTWAVSALPDPEDPDPLRYAILAVLTRLMCDAFNRRIDVGLPRDAPAIVSDFAALAARPKVYEHPPAWAGRVPPLSERVFIPDEKGAISDENDEEVSQELKAMNIIMLRPHIHFI